MPRPKNPVRRRLLALGVGLVVMALGMTVGPSLARVQSGVSLEIVVHQANCPGTLVSTTSTESAAYAKATVRNTSREQVLAIAFGVVVHSPGASGSKPQFIKGPRIPVTIEPGASVELETGLDAAAVSRALKAGRDGGRAELGLLIVDSEDGLNWRSIADRLGHFRDCAAQGRTNWVPRRCTSHRVCVRSTGRRRVQVRGDLQPSVLHESQHVVHDDRMPERVLRHANVQLYCGRLGASPMTRRHRCAWRAPTRAAYGALASIIFRRIGNPTWSLAGCVAVAACTGALVASGCELRFGIRHLASGVELDGLFVAEPTNDARAAFWSWPAYGVWRRQPEFRDVAAEGTPTPAVPLPAHHTTATIRPVSAGYFSALGVRVKGREFVAADDAFGAEPVAVVSEGLLRRLGDNRPSIGSVLQCGPVPLTIVGISQGGFRGTELQSRDDIWIPMRGSIPFKGLPADWLFPDSESTGTPVRWIRVLVRIPPDTTPVAPPSLARADGVRFQPLHVAAYPVAGRRSVALLLRGWTIATLLLVLVACAAVAGVFLAAVYGRRQAVVMRYVVGASAFRVLMAECWRPAAAASLAGGAAMLVTSWLLALWDRLVLPGAVAVSHLSSQEMRPRSGRRASALLV